MGRFGLPERKPGISQAGIFKVDLIWCIDVLLSFYVISPDRIDQESFLKERNGEAVLDQSKIDEINGRIFRIEKKKPFDDKKLGTIQTIITKIK